MEENKKKVAPAPKKPKEKKKLSTFVTFPLVLGATCLVCGGAVSGIYYVTKPAIDQNIAKANAQGLYTMLGEDAIDTMTPVSLKQTAILNTAIDFTVKEGSAHDELNSGTPRYYVLTTPKGFKGSMNIGAIVYTTNSKAVVYDMVITANVNEDGLGYGKWSDPSYEFPGYDGDNFEIIGGASMTSKSVKTALDEALNHYVNGEEPQGEVYTVTDVGQGFGKMSGTVTISDNKVVGFEITDKKYTIADESGWMEGKPVEYPGKENLSTEKFYNTFVKGIVEGDGISFDVFKNASPDSFITSCTQFCNGFIEFINNAIIQHESK